MAPFFERKVNNAEKRLIMRGLQSEKRRNTMVIIAVVLSAFLMSMCGIVAFSLAQVQRNLTDDSYEAVYTSVSEKDISALSKQPEIERVGKYYWLGNYNDKKGYTASVTYFDDSMLYNGRAQVNLIDGSLPTGINEIAADSRYLDKYASDLSLGDTIVLNFQRDYEFTITAIVSNIDTGTDDYGFIVSEKFLKTFPAYDPSEYRGYVHFLNADNFSGQALKNMAATIGEGMQLNNVAFNSLYFARNEGLSTDNLLILSVLTILILFGGSIVIQSIFRISVNEKIHSYGQLRTLGATQKQIKRIVKRESLRLVSIGIPIGIVLGMASGTLLMKNGAAGRLNITYIIIIAVIVSVICLFLVSMSIRKPIKIAAGTSPMEAVRFSPFQGSNSQKQRRQHKINPFSLSLMNFSRDKKKAVSTLCSLIFGGLLLLISASLFTSYSPEQNARLAFPDGDFKIYVNQDGNEKTESNDERNPLTKTLRRDLLSIDGVREVIVKRSSVGGTEFTTDRGNMGGVCDIITSENAAFIEQNLIRGRMPEHENEILLSGTPEYDDISPGDSLPIKFDCSEMVYQAIVVGFFDHYKCGIGNGKLGVDGAQVLVTDDLAKQLMPDTDNFDYTWEIVTDYAKYDAIQNKLEALLAKSSALSMFTFKEEVVTWEVQWNVVTGGMQGISWLIFLFGIVNLINMTLSNMYSRKKEISMMRSVGLTKKQLYKMQISEGFVYVFLSAVLMLVLGVPVSILLCSQLGEIMYMQPMVYQFPFFQIGIYLLLIIVLEIYLAMWSVKNMDKLSLVEQLRATE